MGKSAGVFEAKQKAFHAKESLKLLDIEYLDAILPGCLVITSECGTIGATQAAGGAAE
jgi:hypothetical protein